jgi:hypothetical protein
LENRESGDEKVKRKFIPSPAMVVALISLIVAISGTAVAMPGGLDIGSKDLRADSVGARSLGRVFLGKVAGLSSTDPVEGDGSFTEIEGSIRCPNWAPFAFDPSMRGLGPLAFETNRTPVASRLGGPGGYEFEVLSDLGPEPTLTMKVNCLARR